MLYEVITDAGDVENIEDAPRDLPLQVLVEVDAPRFEKLPA